MTYKEPWPLLNYLVFHKPQTKMPHRVTNRADMWFVPHMESFYLDESGKDDPPSEPDESPSPSIPSLPASPTAELLDPQRTRPRLSVCMFESGTQRPHTRPASPRIDPESVPMPITEPPVVAPEDRSAFPRSDTPTPNAMDGMDELALARRNMKQHRHITIKVKNCWHVVTEDYDCRLKMNLVYQKALGLATRRRFTLRLPSGGQDRIDFHRIKVGRVSYHGWHSVKALSKLDLDGRPITVTFMVR